MRRLPTSSAETSWPSKRIGPLPGSAASMPAITRKKRRLAGAARPEQRDEFAGLHFEIDVAEHLELIEGLADPANFDAHGVSISFHLGNRSLAGLAFNERLDNQSDNRQKGKQGCDGKGCLVVIFVPEFLDAQRHGVIGVGMTGDHGDRAKFAKHARRAENDAIK